MLDAKHNYLMIWQNYYLSIFTYMQSKLQFRIVQQPSLKRKINNLLIDRVKVKTICQYIVMKYCQICNKLKHYIKKLLNYWSTSQITSMNTGFHLVPNTEEERSCMVFNLTPIKLQPLMFATK